MAIIKLSKLRFIPLITQIQKEYKLTYEQAAVYGYLFNHCMNINSDGYCGYSDEKMATEMGLGIRTFQRDMERLKKENLIIIRNPGQRSKKTGKSRMIYINSDVYLEEQQLSIVDLEVEALKKENERLRKQLDQLAKEKSENNVQYGNYYTMYLYREFYRRNQITENQKNELYAVLSSVYDGLAVDYGHADVMKHINYVLEQSKETDIENVIGYLVRSIQDYTYKKKNGYL